MLVTCRFLHRRSLPAKRAQPSVKIEILSERGDARRLSASRG